MNLMNPPSSTDDLLKLLDKVESLLTKVDQHPCDSTRSALQAVMKALIKNELLSHTNEDVKVSVVFCVTELSRITAPKHPYDDHEQMEEILRHTVMVLKKLPDVASPSYRKVVQILNTIAQLRSCVILLDLEYDTLVIYIIKLFLAIIRPYHPHNVFTRMKEIIIQLIEDSDELSVELLQPLLDSVKNENQMAEPISSKLGEKVLEHCAFTVKPYLAEALKSMSLNPDACHEIVASICKMPNKNEMKANENAPDIVDGVKVGPSEATFCEPALQYDDTHREKLKDTCKTNIMTPENPEDVQPATKFCEPALQDDTHREKLKDTCRTNIMTPENVEDVQPAPKFCEPALQDDTHREKLKDTCRTNIKTPENAEDVEPAPNAELSSGSNKLTAKSGQHSLPSKNRNISTGNPGHWDQPKDIECPINEDAQLGVLVPTGGVLQSQGQKKDSLHLDLTGGERTKRTLSGKRKPVTDSRKNDSASDCDAERKSESSTKNEEGNIKEHNEPSLQQIDGMKRQNNEITSEIHNIEESGDKATKLSNSDESHLNKCSNYESKRKLATRKHEDSKRPRTIKDHGEELIGAKIKVWWPLDEAFHEASISSFDPVKNRLKVKYVDGHAEKLNLQKERWEMVEDSSSQKMANENASDTGHPVKVGPSEAKFCEPAPQDDTQREKIKDTHRSPEISHGSHGHLDQPKKSETAKSEDHLDILVAAGDAPDSQVKKKGSLHLGRTGKERNKHTVCTKRKSGKGSRKNESASNCEADCKTEFSIEGEEVTLQQIRGMKQKKKTINIYDFDASGDKDSKRPPTIKSCSKELVGARIKVWWPMDKKFYKAAVSSFDPVTKKHKVEYVDGDVELLRLYEERWEMLEDSSSQKVDTHGEQVKNTCTTNVMKPNNPEDVQPASNAENKLTGSSGQNTLASKNPDISNGSHGQGQPKTKETPTNEDSHLGVLVPAGDVLKSQVKKKGSLHLDLTGGESTKHKVCAKRKSRGVSRKNESASDCNAESKSEFTIKSGDRNIIENKELLMQQIDGMKQKKKRTTTKMHEIEESGDKVDIKTAQDSEKPCSIKDYGEELVGTRIKMWWPLDDKFYEGVVSSFDPEKRKHTIAYDDGDIEKLYIHQFRWEILEDNLTQKDHGLDSQSHAVSSVMSSMKKAKRNSSTEPNISSSKRSKSTAK